MLDRRVLPAVLFVKEYLISYSFLEWGVTNISFLE